MKPDFSEYKLLLLKDGKEVYKSNHDGLRPLIYCIRECKDLKDCLLFDKVIGLAAARLILHTGIIKEIKAGLASEPAIELLRKNNVKIESQEVVKNILRMDRTDVCPREKKALTMSNEEFYNEIRNHVSPYG